MRFEDAMEFVYGFTRIGEEHDAEARSDAVECLVFEGKRHGVCHLKFDVREFAQFGALLRDLERTFRDVGGDHASSSVHGARDGDGWLTGSTRDVEHSQSWSDARFGDERSSCVATHSGGEFLPALTGVGARKAVPVRTFGFGHDASLNRGLSVGMTEVTFFILLL